MYFIGHMTGTTPHFSILCDIFISTLNQNVVKTETALAATYVEWQTLTWLHKLSIKETKFYQKIINHSDKAIGNYCSGGTLGNITALLVARNTAFPTMHQQGFLHAFQGTSYQKRLLSLVNGGIILLKSSEYHRYRRRTMSSQSHVKTLVIK